MNMNIVHGRDEEFVAKVREPSIWTAQRFPVGSYATNTSIFNSYITVFNNLKLFSLPGKNNVRFVNVHIITYLLQKARLTPRK
ncbi:MAG: hypothetical protein K6D55_02345 [Prevotella sp.]|nr:hypothetical protein [Prevotella sp.]